MNITIKIAKWALDNMTVEDDEGQYLAWIEPAKIYGSGGTEDEAVMMAIEVTLDQRSHYISNPESKFVGRALEMRKMFIELFGENRHE